MSGRYKTKWRGSILAGIVCETRNGLLVVTHHRAASLAFSVSAKDVFKEKEIGVMSVMQIAHRNTVKC